jgi:peptidoglycan/xylan/chitin deacetylase (PgdA/CDA1 family)
MNRRDIFIAFGVAVLAALLMILATGSLVSLGLDAGTHVRGRSDRGSVAPIPAVSPRSPAHVPVLCYHYVRGPVGPVHFARVFGYVVLSLPLLDDSELWRVSERSFERQMEYLVAHGYHAVTLEDLHEWQLGRRTLPPKPVVITFDDGDESVYDFAFPVLRRLGLRATIFVVTGRVGMRWNDVRCLDWARLRELQRSGVFDIQSHTHDLHYKVAVGRDVLPVCVAVSERSGEIDDGGRWEDALFDDLSRSRAAIQRQIGRTPEFLAWPYGFGNPAVDQIAMEAGFLRTCALRARTNAPIDFGDKLLLSDTDRYEIPRYTITARTSLRAFRRMLEGTFQPES